MTATCACARWRSRPASWAAEGMSRSEEHTSELQSQSNLVCRLLLEKKKNHNRHYSSTPRLNPSHIHLVISLLPSLFFLTQCCMRHHRDTHGIPTTMHNLDCNYEIS